MSYEVYAGDVALGQFASNTGYHDLIAAVEGKGKKYPALNQLLNDGATGQAGTCAEELRELADEVADDVRDTALGLAKLIGKQTDIVLTDGVIEDDGEEDDTEKGDDGPDLPEDLDNVPEEGRHLFRDVLKAHSGNGTSEVVAHVRAYRALEEAGFDLRKEFLSEGLKAPQTDNVWTGDRDTAVRLGAMVAQDKGRKTFAVIGIEKSAFRDGMTPQDIPPDRIRSVAFFKSDDVDSSQDHPAAKPYKEIKKGA